MTDVTKALLTCGFTPQTEPTLTDDTHLKAISLGHVKATVTNIEF